MDMSEVERLKMIRLLVDGMLTNLQEEMADRLVSIGSRILSIEDEFRAMAASDVRMMESIAGMFRHFEQRIAKLEVKLEAIISKLPE
jgi:uncharacterized protein Yka (UPF0111/DUF47 family)